MPLSDVLYQDHAHRRIQRAVHADRLPHAYLFSGPDGVGKEMLATRLASMLLCSSPREIQPPASAGGYCAGGDSTVAGGDAGKPQQPPAEAGGSLKTWRDACGACVDCELMAAGTHPDFHRIYRTLNKHHPNNDVQKRKAVNLSVDVIRHFVIESIGLRPGRGRAKLYVITEAERLSDGAQNALLKTLEEPPGHGYLILLATSADALLETTRSRCQHIAFHTLPSEFIRKKLIERHGLSEKAATFLAELSQGSPGKAIRFAKLELHDRVRAILDLLASAPADPLGCGNALLDAAKELAATLKTPEQDDAVDLNVARLAQTTILAMVATVLGDIQRAAVGHPPAALPSEPAVPRLAGCTDPEAIRLAIRAIGVAEYQIDRNANTSLVFDVLGISLARGLTANAVTPTA